jgi:hypothetical protein
MQYISGQQQHYKHQCMLTVGGNVLKVPLNILILVERVVIELLKRVEPSIVVLLLTTIGSHQLSRALKKEK